MKILVTGAAGFIGSQVVRWLLGRGDTVVGLDNINDYYPRELKYARLAELGITDAAQMLSEKPGDDGNYPVPSRFCGPFRFVLCDLADRVRLPEIFARERFDAVVHLGAQAGVRYSIENPFAYVDSNLVGFVNILECCRHHAVSHLVYASSSSVYGGNEKVPFSEADRVDCPVSLYAATKKSNELMAYTYSKLYGLKATGLRFFTVYGPWGRPDMAPMLFARAISKGEPIKVFNGGDMIRDFTYVDDIVEGTVRVLDCPPQADASPKGVPHRVFNIGCSNPVRLMDFIAEMESALGKTALKQLMPMQPGDVYQTYADTTALEQAVGYKPHVTLHEGITRFIAWYRSDKNPLR
ncbi:MAG: NAD-dependent epimerase [Bacteroidales bacterium]|nr:NAD-dependent epimerase [Bacteroidales bacterium]